MLGERLVECAEVLLELDANPLFERVLASYYRGQPDPVTTRLLHGG